MALIARIPHRHGRDIDAMRQLAASFKPLIKTDPLPDDARWQWIGEGLNTGDSLADALVDWMHDAGMKDSMRQFVALNTGQSRLDSNTPDVLAQFFQTCHAQPDWLDPALLTAGTRLFHRSGHVAYLVLRNVALMGGYRAAGLNPPLLMTGSLEGGTQRRIAQTMKWVIDCTERDGLMPGGQGIKSTLHVRLVHALIRRKLANRKDWDNDLMGTPINQPDMAITCLGFGMLLLVGLRVMGVPVSERDARGCMHLWKYACWLMGVDEAWLCDDEQAGRVLFYQLLLSQLKPDASSQRLGHALMQDTLGLPYGFPQAIRRRTASEIHLSVTRLFVGRQGMKELGLPGFRLPWYPVSTFMPRYLFRKVCDQFEATKKQLERHGRKQQLALLQLHFGGASPDLVGHEQV